MAIDVAPWEGGPCQVWFDEIAGFAVECTTCKYRHPWIGTAPSSARAPKGDNFYALLRGRCENCGRQGEGKVLRTDWAVFYWEPDTLADAYVVNDSEALEAFRELAQEHDADGYASVVHRFVERFGVPPICKHGLWINCDRGCTSTAARIRLYDIAERAREVSAALIACAELRGDRISHERYWQCLGRNRPRSLGEARKWLCRYAGRWRDIGRLGVEVIEADGYPVMRLTGVGVGGALARCIIRELGPTAELRPCRLVHRCGRWIRHGRKRYCDACLRSGADDRENKRRSRARQASRRS